VSIGGFQEVFKYLPFLLNGLQWTIQLSLLGILGGSIIGLLIASARLSNRRLLSWPAAFYVDFFRTTPLLVQLIWLYYAFPILSGVSLDSFQAGVFGLSVYSAAFLSEIFRAGLLSIDRGQMLAGQALGMSGVQVFQRVLLPQAVVRMLPPFTNSFVTLIKESSLASVIAVPELLRQTQNLTQFTFRPLEGLTVAAFLYFGLTFPLAWATNTLHRRLSRLESRPGKSEAEIEVKEALTGKDVVSVEL
jgi:polar amino acid transport system permease protein